MKVGGGYVEILCLLARGGGGHVEKVCLHQRPEVGGGGYVENVRLRSGRRRAKFKKITPASRFK